MSREQQAELSGAKLSRDERKALRILDLRDCTPERRATIKANAEKAIESIQKGHTTQKENGIAVSDSQIQRNLTPHMFMLECLASI